MALIDDPVAWILRLFEMEVQEGRGADCQWFQSGVSLPDLPLERDELVYGIYKDIYYFTPLSFITKRHNNYERIRWDTIANVSTQHGSGNTFSKLTLTNGSVVKVRIGDFAVGWRGRISQLFHQMINKWGAGATFGPPPLSIEKFFAAATDDYCLAPNLMPHPPLQEMKDALLALRDERQVTDVLLKIVDFEDHDPISDAVIVRTTSAEASLEAFAERFGADGVIDAPDDVRRFFPEKGDQSTKLIIWD